MAHRLGCDWHRPFSFDLTERVRSGENTISVHVANTIAPHYQTIPAQNLGPVKSGLIGPVRLTRIPIRSEE